MKIEHCYRWHVVDRGRQCLTPSHLTEAQVRRDYPECEPRPMLESLQIVQVPETAEEILQQRRSTPGQYSPSTPSSSNEPAPAIAPFTPKRLVQRSEPCNLCRSELWVCEDHPDVPFQACDCGAPGMRCLCNPAGEVRWREIYAERDPDA